MSTPPFLPPDFEVPEPPATDRMVLRILTIHDAVKDYDAVMTSSKRLRTVFRPGGKWPQGLSLQQNIIELAWHQHEAQRRSSFAYSVLNPEAKRVLGCVYLNPSTKVGYDVEVWLWVRESEADTGLDEHLYETVHDWVTTAWPFKNPAYPGREIPWDTWEELEDA